MVTKAEIKQMGYYFCQGIPENNWRYALEKAVDDGCDSMEEVEEYYSNECYEAESNCRQFSPFEFTAKELNDLQDSKPYDVWEVFEEGIHKYIQEYWEENVENIREHFEDSFVEEENNED